jgi:hypothetical protein
LRQMAIAFLLGGMIRLIPSSVCRLMRLIRTQRKWPS